MQPLGIIERFNVWKTFTGNESVFAEDAPIDELFALPGGIEAEINLIKKLAVSEGAEADNDFSSWQFCKESYPTVAEARFQHLVMFAYKDMNEGADLFKPFHILVRIVKNTSIIPIVAKGEFIVLPTYFFRVIDKFWAGHFLLSNIGEGFKLKDEKTGYITTDYILGRSAEIGIRSNFKRANESLSHLTGLIAGLETYPMFFGRDYNADEMGSPVYFPEFTRKNMMKVQEEFGQFKGKLELEEGERIIFILTTTCYAILHECSHILLGHVNRENADTRDFRVEEEADKYALLLYVKYMNLHYSLLPSEPMETLKCIVGPLSFFETFLTAELLRYTFHFNDPVGLKVIAKNILELFCRKGQLRGMLFNTFKNDESALYANLVREFEATSILCVMIIGQMVNKEAISYDQGVQIINDENKARSFFKFMA